MLKDSNPKQIWVPEQVQQTLRDVKQPGERLYQTVERLANAAKQQQPTGTEAATRLGSISRALNS